MPRSSKHKSSKHSSRDSREYSDSEKDFGLKDRKGKDEVVAKDSSSSEKRKLDSKDVHGSGNGEYVEDYGSSKRRKERSSDGLGERWNGGNDDRGDGSKKSRTSGDPKVRRRDESAGMYEEGDELKKTSGKSEVKHKDSGRKENRESGLEKERKVKEGRSERTVDNEEHRISKQVPENTTDSKGLDELRGPELDNQLERRMRKKRDDLVDREKHQDHDGDGYDRRLSSRDDIAKDARQKDEKQKDEKYRGKYREEMDRENKHRHDKQRDDRPAKDHTSNRVDAKYTREEKDNTESREKRTKISESDSNHNRDHDEDRDCELDSGHDRERHHERSRDQSRARDRDRDYDHDRDHDYDKDWGWDGDRDHDCERDRDKDRDRDRDWHRERDGSHVDDRNAKSKESGTKKRTLDDHDDYSDTKYRVVKAQYSDAEKRSGRADSDADRGRSQSRHAHADSFGTSNKTRSSPISNSHIGKEEYRNVKSEDPKFRDTMVEERAKGSRDGFSGLSERPKYRSMDKTTKIDDGPAGDLLTERSSSSKASPMGLVERSPSSTSVDRRYMNRSGVKRSLEIEETGRRNFTDGRDFTSKDRLNQELTLEKPPLDEDSQADSSFYGRNSQGNASLIPPPPAFRSGIDRSFMGPLEDDVRDNSGAHYRRSSDAGFGRGQGNSWRGVPNWASPLPNGFLPFQHGPAGFQAMIPQFPSQPLFGVRPPMEVNHAGLPYHVSDADRFPGHMRPLGWQNIMDGTGPSHLHGWDNNGVFRDDPHMYGGSDWERKRHLTNSRGWDSGYETRKEENGDLKELSSATSKDESVPSQVDDALVEQVIQMSHDVHRRDSIDEKAPEIKLFSLSSPSKGPVYSSSGAPEKVSDTSTPSDKSSLFSRFYLSKIDISAELATPELYDQCICLLNVKKNACIDADASMDLYFKNGSRARQIYAATLSRASPFPAIDTSIFQKALDIYKKQRMKIPNGKKLDIISVFNQVQVDEPVTRPRSEILQVSVSTSDVVNMPMSTSDLKEAQTISPPKEDLEDIEPTHSHDGNDQVCNHSLQVAMSGPSSGHKNQGESIPGLIENKDAITSEQVNSGHAEETFSKAVKTPSQLASSLQKCGDNLNGKAKIPGFACGADEKMGYGETLGGSIVFEDGSGKAFDALMPGSSESESVIVSRIHHSPESTH